MRTIKKLQSGIVILLLLCCALTFKHDLSGTASTESVHGSAKLKKKIVFIAGGCSHGPMEHEYKAGAMLLANAINKHMPQAMEAVVHYNTWPTDAAAFEGVAAIVLFVDGGGGNPALKHLDHLEAQMKKGIGLVGLHYALEVPKEMAGSRFRDWLGGYFETYWSVNPVWEAKFTSLPNHPVTRGVKPFALTDEWYYHMRFRENMQGVTPILTAVPPASTLDRKDGPHENNAHVRAAKGQPQHVAWASERPNGGRGFGFTGGHYHKNWADDNYRRLVLNAILWVAKVDVPKGGFPLQPMNAEDIQANTETKPCR
jgi:type 1 glutamine amidotransferase